MTQPERSDRARVWTLAVVAVVLGLVALIGGVAEPFQGLAIFAVSAGVAAPVAMELFLWALR